MKGKAGMKPKMHKNKGGKAPAKRPMPPQFGRRKGNAPMKPDFDNDMM